MPLIPDQTTTKTIIDAAVFAAQTPRHSRRLGASVLGNECDRAIWFGFRWASKRQFDPEKLRMFAVAEYFETMMAREITQAGMTLFTEDTTKPVNSKNRQISFEFASGHGVAYVDGMVSRVHEAPNKWHVWEGKSMGKSKFNEFVKHCTDLDGLEKKQPRYAAQIRVAMLGMGTDRTLYSVVNRDTLETHNIRFRQQQTKAVKAVERAERIITTDRAPAVISDDPTYFKCKLCDYQPVCHESKVAEVNCRTCAHSTAVTDGNWHCRTHDNIINRQTLSQGCPLHVFHPEMHLRWLEPIDATDRGVAYKNLLTGNTFVNGPQEITSHEMVAAKDPKFLGNIFVDEIKEAFPGAEIVG